MSKHTSCSKGLQSNPERRDGSYQGRWKNCVPTCKSMWTHTHSVPRGNTESFPSHFRSTGPWPKPPPTLSLNDIPDPRFAVHRADPPSQGSYQKVPRKQLIWRRSSPMGSGLTQKSCCPHQAPCWWPGRPAPPRKRFY